MASVTTWTVEDFEKLSDDEARNKELINGELVQVSGNTGEHIELRDYITALLLFHVLEHGGGKVLSEQEYLFGKNAHGIDVSFFGKAKLPLYDPKRRAQSFVPDLAIEVASYNDRFGELEEKIAKYLGHGVSEVWVFSLVREKAFVYSNEREAVLSADDAFAPAAIPGFSIGIRKLFDRTV